VGRKGYTKSVISIKSNFLDTYLGDSKKGL